MPSTRPVSTSLIEAATIDDDQVTRVVGLVFGDRGSVGLPLSSSTGASLTSVTVMEAVSTSVLKAVVPPLVGGVDLGALAAAGLVPGPIAELTLSRH